MHIVKQKKIIQMRKAHFCTLEKREWLESYHFFFLVASTSSYNMQFEKISHVANTIHFLKKNASNNGDIWKFCCNKFRILTRLWYHYHGTDVQYYVLGRSNLQVMIFKCQWNHMLTYIKKNIDTLWVRMFLNFSESNYRCLLIKKRDSEGKVLEMELGINQFFLSTDIFSHQSQ